MRHVAVLDEGTTSTRAVVFADDGAVVAESSRRLGIHTPAGLKVEQDPVAIVEASADVLREALAAARGAGRDVECVAITNQRTSTTLLDAATGAPVSPTVSWQDGRAAAAVDAIRPAWGARFERATRTNLAACNVALHAAALLEDPRLRRRADEGRLILGTVDTVLLSALAGLHATSASNASAYGAMDFRAHDWWDEWLRLLDLPRAMMPTILADDADFGLTDGDRIGAELPIRCVIADQQSALFGHAGFEVGAAKCTLGTGTFLNFNIGDQIPESLGGLDLRTAWAVGSTSVNCLEGASLVSGSAIEWLTQDMGLLGSPSDVDAACGAATPSGLVVVPALAGLASPTWGAAARGTAFGMSRHTSDADFVEATVTGIAQSVVDLLEAMTAVSGIRPTSLSVDGGLSRSRYLLQMISDLSGVPVARPAGSEYATARGAAWIAGVASGIWADPAEAAAGRTIERRFEPRMRESERSARRAAWKDALGRTIGWRARQF